jgi:lipoprotein NlpI
MRQFKYSVLAPLLFAVACGGSAPEAKSGDKALRTNEGKLVVSQKAQKDHGDALNDFIANEKAFSWNEEKCRSIAERFIRASKAQEDDLGKPLPSALYNAGVAYMRCGMQDEAQTQFRAATDADGDFHRGRAQLALFEFQKTKDLDSTISQLEQVIRDAKFQNVDALVSVASLQMERGGDQANDDGPNDFERAKKNIQRALAIDDSFMPAFNQLAIYYMEVAKRAAGESKGRRRGLVVAGQRRAKIDQQQLELAALVASQAIMKNGNYAPIHNTAGLIQVQMDNFNGAVKSFGRARQLDPKFFEAHMNYAAVNLSFRGFGEAEAAYRDALKLVPTDYEAQLGLALALRGQINDSNFDKQVAETQKHLDECKKISPDRAEAYYNEAILTQEYRAKSGGDPKQAIPTLRKAQEQYQAFIGRASDDAFAEAVKRSKDRIQDINDTIQFVEDSEKMRKQQEEIDAQMKADEERMKKEEAEAKKAEEAAKKAEEDKKKAEADAKLKAEADKKAAADAKKAPPVKAEPAAPATPAPAKK